jgi:hypothetical protein
VNGLIARVLVPRVVGGEKDCRMNIGEDQQGVRVGGREGEDARQGR